MYYTAIQVNRRHIFVWKIYIYIFLLSGKNMAEHVPDDGFYILNVLLVVNYSFVKLTLVVKTVSALR